MNNSSTALAIALQYDPDEGRAPIVTAKGEGFLAEKIIAIAEEHGITLHHDAGLAQAMSHLEVSSEIPSDLYKVVAEVLAFVLQKESELANN